jgi:hypothetical protein
MKHTEGSRINLHRCKQQIVEQFHSSTPEEVSLATLLQTLNKTPIQDSKPLLTLLYQRMAHTRDILNGKGEYQNAYVQLFAWSKPFPELAKRALETFVLPSGSQMPYGSWKDIKYLCEYCRIQSKSLYHPLIRHSIRLMNRQLWIDSTEAETENLSLVAKWIPREHSKYGWLFRLLAKDYFAAYYEKANTPEAYQKAEKKAKMNYRKLIASLNRRIDTVQIKQCANDWANIDPSKIPTITYKRQKNAFLNRNKKGNLRTIKDDRVHCALSFEMHSENPTVFVSKNAHSPKECDTLFEMSAWEKMVFLLQKERYRQMSDIIEAHFTTTFVE